MRKHLATLAIAALLGVPFAVNAETYMPSDDQIQPGMIEGDRVDTTEVLDSSETIKAEIVEIDGNRLITEMENGDQLVFLVEGSPDNLNVGDELELKVDDQAKSAVILNVLPQDRDRQSERHILHFRGRPLWGPTRSFAATPSRHNSLPDGHRHTRN